MTERHKDALAFLVAIIIGVTIAYVCVDVIPAPWGVITIITIDALLIANLVRLVAGRR